MHVQRLHGDANHSPEGLGPNVRPLLLPRESIKKKKSKRKKIHGENNGDGQWCVGLYYPGIGWGSCPLYTSEVPPGNAGAPGEWDASSHYQTQQWEEGGAAMVIPTLTQSWAQPPERDWDPGLNYNQMAEDRNVNC